MKELNDYLFSLFGEEMYEAEENRRKIARVCRDFLPTLLGMVIGSIITQEIKNEKKELERKVEELQELLYEARESHD